MNKILSLLIVSVSISAWGQINSVHTARSGISGGQDGNGGDAIVCRMPDGKIKTAQLLDFYEYQTFEGGRIDLGGDHLSSIEKARFALRRMNRVAPTRALLYEQGLDNFLSESEFVKGPLLDLPDQGPTGMPKGCKLEQLAIQTTCYPGQIYSNPACLDAQFYFENYYSWNQTIHGRKRYKIDAEIWSALDENSKAGLMLHELLYREFANLEGLNSSDLIRKITSLISSNEMTKISQEEFNRVANFSVADVDFNNSLGKLSLFIMKKGPFADLTVEATQLYSPVQSLRDEVRNLPVRFFVNGEAYLAEFKAQPLSTPIVMGPFWPVEPIDNFRSERLFIVKNSELQWLQLAAESPDLKFNFIAQNKVYLTRGYGVSDERVYLNLRGKHKVNILGQDVELGSSDQGFTTAGFNIKSGLFVFGQITQPLDLSGSSFKLQVAKDSIVSLRSDGSAIKFLTQTTGIYLEPWSKNTFELGDARVLFSDRGDVQYAASNSSTGLMRANIEIYPGKTVEVQNSFAKLNYLPQPGRKIEQLEMQKVRDGIFCIYKGTKYVARTNVSLRLSDRIGELPKIVKADEIPNMVDRSNEYDLEFCQVVQEQK
jgi:hypothetical protein